MYALKLQYKPSSTVFDTAFILGSFKEAELFSYQFCMMLLPQKQNQRQP